MDERIVLARELVIDAGFIIRRRFNNVETVIEKGEKDFTLDADMEAEEAVLKKLKEKFPNDAILSEEAGEFIGDSEFKWIIDPLDGTANFKAGIPYFCSSVSLQVGEKLYAAFVYDPMNDKIFEAKRGKGATMNDEEIRVSEVSSLQKFLVSYSTSNHKNDEQIETGSKWFNAALKNCRAVRLQGSSLLDLCFLASGTFDGLFKLQPNYWDFAAGCLILEEAGGVATDENGEPWGENTHNLIASNNKLHSEFKIMLTR
jgi:myo-inositol-1(or 4)-monophosphatase